MFWVRTQIMVESENLAQQLLEQGRTPFEMVYWGPCNPSYPTEQAADFTLCFDAVINRMYTSFKPITLLVWFMMNVWIA